MAASVATRRPEERPGRPLFLADRLVEIGVVPMPAWKRSIDVAGALVGLLLLIPLFALAMVGANMNFPFGGASILIIVGVGLETVKQIDSQLQQRHYEGLLR